MDFSLSEEQQEVQGLARKILEDLVTNERLKEIEAGEEAIDRDAWEELGRANLLGVGISDEYGGSDLGFLTVCVLLEEVGRRVAPVPALETMVLGAGPISEFGSEAQKRRWLSDVAGGRAILTGALAEVGNDQLPRPRARADGDGFRLHGTLECVPFAEQAQGIVVAARTDDDRTIVALLDPGRDGVSRLRQHVTNKLPHCRIVLDDARIGIDDLIGTPERGAEIVRWLVDRATAAYCCMQVGVSAQALAMTAEYTSSRKQFDRPVGSFQAVHQRAGDAYVNAEAMRLSAWQAAFRLADGLPDEGALAVAKFWAAEGGQFVGYAAQHLHGGIGIDVDYPLHRYYLWAKQIELTLGPASLQLARLGERMAAETVHYEG